MSDLAGWLSPAGVVVVAVGAVVSVASGRRALTVLWLAGALVLDVPQDPELASLWCAPAAILIASSAFERWQRFLLPVVAICVIAVFAGGFRTLAYRHDRVGPLRVAERVAALTSPDALVVSPEPEYAMLHARRAARGWAPGAGPLWAVPAEARSLAEQLGARVAAGRPVIVLRSSFLVPGGVELEAVLRDRFALDALERVESEAPSRSLRRLARIDETIYALAERR
jgi:hypothetical protein